MDTLGTWDRPLRISDQNSGDYSPTLPGLILKGTARERGRTYGQTFADKIKENVRRSLAVPWMPPWIACRELIRDIYVPTLQNLWPEALAEMSGIALGCKMDVDLVVLLNVRDDIAAIGHLLEFVEPPPAGTNLHPQVRDAKQSFSAWFPAGSMEDGEPLLAHVWPAPGKSRDFDLMVCLEIQSPSSLRVPSIFMVVEAGMISGVGMNSQGLAVAGNSLFSNKDDVPEFGESILPMTCFDRGLLQSVSMGDARLWCNHSTQHSCRHVFFAEGDTQHSCELTPLGVFTCLGKPGATAKIHTNHFSSFEMYQKRREIGDRNGPRPRDERLFLLRQLGEGTPAGTLSRENITSLFLDMAWPIQPRAMHRYPVDSRPQAAKAKANGEDFPPALLVMLNPKRKIISVCSGPEWDRKTVHYTFDSVPELGGPKKDSEEEEGGSEDGMRDDNGGDDKSSTAEPLIYVPPVF